MKQKLTAILALTVLAGSAHAVTCQNSIPSSNPNAIYEISTDGASVTDTRTGLTWKRCLEGMEWSGTTCTGTPTIMSWATALDHAKSQGSDWRLPNIKELRSLVEECRTSPAINDTVFSDMPSSYVWSGSPSASYTSYAWFVLFSNGYSNDYYRSDSLHVRLVRGGQSFDPLPEAVPGACSAAQGVASTTAPATNLCSAGTASSVTNSSGQWQWSCAGENGGATQGLAWLGLAWQSMCLLSFPSTKFFYDIRMEKRLMQYWHGNKTSQP